MLTGRKLLAWLLIATAIVLPFASIWGSFSFQQCVADGGKYNTRNPEDESPPNVLMPPIYSGRVVWICTGTFIDKNEAAIVAIATVLIAIFTGTLWRATTNQERMARTHERAYVMYGGLYGKPNNPNEFARSKQAGDGAWRDASLYTEPWFMQIHNFGRTPGFIKKVTWGVCDKDKFIAGKSVTEIIRCKLIPMEAAVEVETVVNLTTVDHPVPYRYVEPGRFDGQVFFGRIDYMDVFRDPHHSTWAVEHRAQSSVPIGTTIGSDWS